MRRARAEDGFALISAILSAEPAPMVGHDTATSDVEWLVCRCLKKNPDARWQSMSDVEGVLKWIASSARRLFGASLLLHGSTKEDRHGRHQARNRHEEIDAGPALRPGAGGQAHAIARPFVL